MYRALTAMTYSATSLSDMRINAVEVWLISFFGHSLFMKLSKPTSHALICRFSYLYLSYRDNDNLVIPFAYAIGHNENLFINGCFIVSGLMAAST